MIQHCPGSGSAVKDWFDFTRTRRLPVRRSLLLDRDVKKTITFKPTTTNPLSPLLSAVRTGVKVQTVVSY